MAETNWGDPEELANMSRLGNVLQGMGYDPEAARANPAMRAEIMNRVAQPYPAQQRAMPAQLAQMAQNTPPPKLDTQLAAPTTPPIDIRNAAPRTPAMTPAAQPSSPASSGLIVRPIGQGSTDTPANSATGGSKPLPDTLPTSLTGAASGGPKPATSSQVSPSVTKVPDSTGSTNGPKPATSSQVSPSGTSRPDFLGGAGQALRGGLTAAEAYERNVENAPSPEDTSAIDARIEKESTAPPLRDASGKIFHGGVDASGKPLPNYKEGIWGEIGRGAKGALEGFSIGGIPGAVMGAVNPTMFPNDKAYGAPNSNYDRAVEANQQTLAGDQQSKADLLARFKTTMDARNAQQGGYEKSVKNFGDVGKLGTEGQTAETAADKEAREAAIPNLKESQPIMGPDGKPHTYMLDEKGNKAVDLGVHYERPMSVNLNNMPVPAMPGSSQGEEFLRTLPTNIADEVRAIGEGRLAPPSASSRSPQAQQILQAVNRAYPGYDAAQFPTYSATRKQFTSGTIGQAINSFNTALNHLSRLEQHLPDNSYFSSVNAVENAITPSGSKRGQQLATYDADATAVSNEVSRAYKGGVITKEEYDHMNKLLNRNAAPENLKANIQEFRGLLQGKLQSYQQQWESSMPPGAVSPISTIQGNAGGEGMLQGAPQGGGQAAPGGGGSSWAQQHGFRKAQP